MQTAFTPEQLSRPQIAEADGILKTCVHYGFCTATCPTYVLFRDENDSPRGRIDLIRAMLEKGGTPDAKTVHHLDRCLSCLSCVTTCAVKVDYAHLIDIARDYIEDNYRRPLGERMLRPALVGISKGGTENAQLRSCRGRKRPPCLPPVRLPKRYRPVAGRFLQQPAHPYRANRIAAAGL